MNRSVQKRPLQSEPDFNVDEYGASIVQFPFLANTDGQSHGSSVPWSQQLNDYLDFGNLTTKTSEVSGVDITSYDFSASIEADIETWYRHQDFDFPNVNDASDAAFASEQAGSQGNRLCYGMIYRTRVRLVGDMQRHLSSIPQERTLRNGSYCVLSTAIFDAALHIVLSGNVKFALANKSLNIAFQDQDIYSKVNLQVIASIGSLNRAMREATRATDAHVNVDINVYGTVQDQSEVGRYLARQKIWLQKPDWHEPDTRYDNPHVLSFSRARLPRAATGSTIATGSGSSEDVMLDSMVSEVYANLTRATHLERTAGDARLATHLMPHQEEALHFMIERENGPVSEEYRLWKPVSTEHPAVYQHSITGARDYELPTEIGGGILADEMGMGKTFSMLALIVRTLHDAHEWSINPESHHAVIEELAGKSFSKATLVVVPSPLILNNWLSELDSRVKIHELSIFVYHGTSRPTDPTAIINHDIVFTTYQTLVSERNRGESILAKIAWFRIVLDEAHFIRRSTTKFYRCVAELEARSRWCLTGTPVQNHLDDIGALFAFLRILPFDRLGTFRKHISLLYHESKLKRSICQEKLRMLIDCVCLRRDRALLSLDNVEEIESAIDFSAAEQEQYSKTKADLKAYMELHPTNTTDDNRFGMFQAQLHLRLICNHGTYQQSFGLNSVIDRLDLQDEMTNLANVDGEIKCDNCEQYIRVLNTNDLIRSRPFLCPHTICDECRGLNRGACVKCASLHNPMKISNIVSGRKQTSRFHPTGISSKISALLSDLSGMAPDDKSIVFSCWTSTLDLIQHHLHYTGIKYCRIDGNLPLKDRESILECFDRDPDTKVLIMTTGVGGFGINLIAANRVFLFEPQWNPSVESQAIGRTLRIGQSRKVKVVRYIIRGTVEGDIRKLQRNKAKIARMARHDDSFSTTRNELTLPPIYPHQW